VKLEAGRLNMFPVKPRLPCWKGVGVAMDKAPVHSCHLSQVR